MCTLPHDLYLFYMFFNTLIAGNRQIFYDCYSIVSNPLGLCLESAQADAQKRAGVGRRHSDTVGHLAPKSWLTRAQLQTAVV